jgi:hypothetical protein
VRAATIVLGSLPHPGQGGGVVEADAHRLLHRDRAPDALHPSHDIGPTVTVRHQVDDRDLAVGGDPARLEHERAVAVEAPGRAGRADRGESPVPVLRVAKQGAERGAGVESR